MAKARTLLNIEINETEVGSFAMRGLRNSDGQPIILVGNAATTIAAIAHELSKREMERQVLEWPNS